MGINRAALPRFALRVAAIFLTLTAVFTAIGLMIKAVSPPFDVAVMQAIAAESNPEVLSLARIVTIAGSFGLLGPLAVAFILLRRWKRPADDLSLLVIAGGCALLPTVIKLIIQRPRPTFGNVTHLVTYSFPSEHTTQAAGIYLAIAILLSKDLARGWRELVVMIGVLLALAVAWSRVYLGVHYPTDVIAGLLLGWSWALLVYHWARPVLTQSVANRVTTANGAATS